MKVKTINLNKNMTAKLNKYGSVIVGFKDFEYVKIQITKDIHGNIYYFPITGKLEIKEYET